MILYFQVHSPCVPISAFDASCFETLGTVLKWFFESPTRHPTSIELHWRLYRQLCISEIPYLPVIRASVSEPYTNEVN